LEKSYLSKIVCFEGRKEGYVIYTSLILSKAIPKAALCLPEAEFVSSIGNWVEEENRKNG
jgi:hypothetical protein